MIDRKPVFDAVRSILGRGFSDSEVRVLDDALDAFEAHAAGVGHNQSPSDRLTVKVAQEIVEHEAIVLEAYRDSVGVLTWGVGVTNKSGHRVERYKDNPQTIERCLEIFVWLLRTEYMPDVLAEFEGHELTEGQFAAALSFHWNTGAIRQASWCDAWKAGNIEDAKERFMLYRKPAAIIPRRQRECDLFFDGVWSQDGLAPVIPVRKPSYTPNWGAMKQVDIRADLERALRE